MQLKEFSLLSPVVESGTVLKALETAIPTEAIEQASPNVHTPPWGIAQTHSNEERKRAIPIASGSLFNHCNELVVKRLF